MEDFKELSMDNRGVRYDSLHYKLNAYSTVAIGYTFKSEKGKLLFDAFAYFIRSKSWIKSPNEAILKHEKGHFDIAEIYSRKLEQAVGEIKNIENPLFWTSFQRTFQEINGVLLNEHDKYDEMSRTSLGRDYYYEKIQEELKASE
jgi:hypothetical protein